MRPGATRNPEREGPTLYRNSHVFQPHLEETSPVWAYLECASQFSNDSQTPPWLHQDLNPGSPNFQDAANNFANTSINNRYLIQTSKAATIFNAGVKVRLRNPYVFPHWLFCRPQSNELAESAVGTFNVRIEIFSNGKIPFVVRGAVCIFS